MNLSLVELEVCDSTNDEAWKYPAGSLVVAHQQRHGRGRQGRIWKSNACGNIYASMHLGGVKKNLRWLPLAAGISAVESLVQSCETLKLNSELENLRLKWPNDIYCNDAKLGGVLCESRIIGEQVSGVVIGLGLNLVHAPTIEGITTACVFKDLPVYLSKMRILFLYFWASQLIYWKTQLEENQTQLLQQTWKKWAKITDHQLVHLLY